jgi:cytochrome d ubiquinol oxidase subunit I
VLGGAVFTTLVLFVLVYAVIFSAGIYYINRLLAHGLDVAETAEASKGASPFAAAAQAGRETLGG